VGDVDFEVFVGVDFTSITLKCEGFLLDGEEGVGDEVGERVTTSGWWDGSGWGGMGWWTRVGKVEVKL